MLINTAPNQGANSPETWLEMISLKCSRFFVLVLTSFLFTGTLTSLNSAQANTLKKISISKAGRVVTPGINTLLSGKGAPKSTLGIDGDFYIDTKAMNIYGPKVKGKWPAGVSLKGTAGTNGTNGTNGSTGATGATGAKGTATNGVDGATGPTDASGSSGSGSAGSPGATGATGATGAQGPQELQVQLEHRGQLEQQEILDLSGDKELLVTQDQQELQDLRVRMKQRLVC